MDGVSASGPKWIQTGGSPQRLDASAPQIASAMAAFLAHLKNSPEGTTPQPVGSTEPEERGGRTSSLSTDENHLKIGNFELPGMLVERFALKEVSDYIEGREKYYEVIFGKKVEITITSNADHGYTLSIQFDNSPTTLTSVPFEIVGEFSENGVETVKNLLTDIDFAIVNHLQENSPREDLSFVYLADTHEVQVTNSGVDTIMSLDEAIDIYQHGFSAPTTDLHEKYLEYSFEDIESMLNELYSDGKLTQAKIGGFPILVDLINNGLGWGSLDNFLRAFNGGEQLTSKAIQDENFQILLDGIEALIDPSESFTINAADFKSIKIPEGVNNVVIETEFGPISINGPKASEYAGAWLTAYEDSPTFKNIMDNLVSQSESGKYSINIVALTGNVAGANHLENREGFYLSNNISDHIDPAGNPLGLIIGIMSHEALHDFHNAEAVSGLDAGGVHSTEQATLAGAIFNELIGAGTDLGSHQHNADSASYTADVRLLSNDSLEATNIVASMVDHHPEININTLRNDYALFQSLIVDGNYQAALGVLEKYDGLSIYLQSRDPAAEDSFFADSYDIQTLFMKDLLVNGDGLDWFQEVPSVSKGSIIEFFDFLKMERPDLESKFRAAFDLLRLDIERDYPGLEFTSHP